MRFLAPLVLIALPMPGLAQRSFSLPPGCEAFVTVQSRGCTVSHHFTCESDPEGLQRRVDLSEEGMVYAGAIDRETQWIESFHFLSGHSERLAPNPADPASFTNLLQTNLDTFDFETLSDEVGTQRYVGQDRLTGETVTIDGVDLLQTEYQIVAYAADGTEMWRSTGNEYISPEWRMFMSGTSEVTTPDDSWEDDGSPREFIFPGEDGFLSASPKFDCGVVMSSWSPAE